MPRTRAPLTKAGTVATSPAPSSRTLTHVHQAASLPVEHVEEPTLRDGPVVTPRPPGRSAGRSSRKSTEQSPLSSSGSSLEPPAPSGAARAASGGYSPKCDGDTTRDTVGPDSPRDPAAWCPRTGTLQAPITSTASGEWTSSAFDPSLEYSTEDVVLFWHSPSYFSQWSPLPFVVDGVPYSCAEQFMMAEKARLFRDHRASRTHHVFTRSEHTQTYRSKRAQLRLYCLGQREAKCRVIWQLRQVHAEPRHETPPFEHSQ